MKCVAIALIISSCVLLQVNAGIVRDLHKFVKRQEPVPEVEEDPEVPDVPDVPEVVEVPEVPEGGEVPEEDEVPEGGEVPDGGEVPAEPAVKEGGDIDERYRMCYKELQATYGEQDFVEQWKKNITYDAKDVPTSIPLSYAIFDVCSLLQGLDENGIQSVAKMEEAIEKANSLPEVVNASEEDREKMLATLESQKTILEECLQDVSEDIAIPDDVEFKSDPEEPQFTVEGIEKALRVDICMAKKILTDSGNPATIRNVLDMIYAQIEKDE